MSEAKEWGRAIANVILSGGVSTEKPISRERNSNVDSDGRCTCEDCQPDYDPRDDD